MKKQIIFIALSIVVAFACNREQKNKGTDLLKFRGSWFLRVYEIDFLDSINPGKLVLEEGNETFADFSSKTFNLLKEGKLHAYDDSGNVISFKKVCLNMVGSSLRSQIDTNNISESEMLNLKLVGIELNDSIFLDIRQNKKEYFMHSVNLFIPAEFNPNGGNQSICKIMYNDFKGMGFDTELKALEDRNFARKEKIYHHDGSIGYEYTFYLTDAAGVEYYFRVPLEKVLADDRNIENSILHYFKDDLVDK
jgi:hypothetical protein